MPKKVFIIHGWDGYPEEGWFPWLRDELSERGFNVFVPSMPNPESPEIGSWVSTIKQAVGQPDSQIFFVGHSIGCQAIIRYLESLPDDIMVGGALFVAGWFTLKGLESEEERLVASPWLTAPIDFSRVKSHGGKFVALFSDNDPFVPLENEKMFADYLGAKTLVKPKQDHFKGSEGINRLPEALTAMLEITGG